MKNSKTKSAFYHQNEPLLFQFIFYECLCVLRTLEYATSPDQLIAMTTQTSRWHKPSGHLPRLKHYLSLFSANFDTTSFPIQRYMVENKTDPAQIKKEIHALVQLLLKKASDYREHPTILYFLIRHQGDFDTVLPEPLVFKWIQTCFSPDLKDLEQFLTQGYIQKGFDYLVPSIESYMQKIKSHA